MIKTFRGRKKIRFFRPPPPTNVKSCFYMIALHQSPTGCKSLWKFERVLRNSKEFERTLAQRLKVLTISWKDSKKVEKLQDCAKYINFYIIYELHSNEVCDNYGKRLSFSCKILTGPFLRFCSRTFWDFSLSFSCFTSSFWMISVALTQKWCLESFLFLHPPPPLRLPLPFSICNAHFYML